MVDRRAQPYPDYSARRALQVLRRGDGLTPEAFASTFALCKKCKNVIANTMVVHEFHRCTVDRDGSPETAGISAFVDTSHLCGMPKEDFAKWALCCSSCNMVYLTWAFKHHNCPGRGVEQVVQCDLDE